MMTYIEFATHIGVAHGTVKRWALEGLPVDRSRGLKYPLIEPVAGAAWVKEHRPDSIAIRRSGLVYIVVRDFDGAAKIGWTSDLERRLREIRKESRCATTLLLALPGTKGVELALHEKFTHRRIEGEWFLPAEEIVKWTEERAIGLEPTTSTLARSHSTIELRPHATGVGKGVGNGPSDIKKAVER